MSRYLSPAALERNRQSSREAKLRRRGTCEDCGAETRYNGHTENGPSRYCHHHAMLHYGEPLKGAGPRQRELHTLLADAGEMRFMEIVNAMVVSSSHMAWRLAKEMQSGRIIRVRRGVYKLSAD